MPPRDPYEAETLRQLAAVVYGQISAQAQVHSRPLTREMRETAIQTAVDDSLKVAAKILDGSRVLSEARSSPMPLALEQRSSGPANGDAHIAEIVTEHERRVSGE